MTLSEPPTPFQIAREYRRVWDGGPYTSFDTIQYLIEKTTINATEHDPRRPANMRDFLRDPTILQGVPGGKMIQDSLNPHGRLHPLFAGRTGLCTSFAMKVVDALNRMAPPGTYDFGFYDLDWHRLARCKNTGLLIDSSARGPRHLKVGAELKIPKVTYFCDDSKLKFRSGMGKGSAIAMGNKMALTSCLKQLAKNEKGGSFLCFFRGHVRNSPCFDGMIKWRPDLKSVILTWKEPGATDDGDMPKVTIRFGTGNPQTNKDCFLRVGAFLRATRNGINRMEQFSCVSGWHHELWANAITEWGGFPRILPGSSSIP